MSDYIDLDWLVEPIAVAITLAIVVYLILAVSIIAGLAFLTISGLVAVYRYNKYVFQARADFRRVEGEAGLGHNADEVLAAIFGAGVLTKDGFDEPFDWLNETALGITLDEAQ